MKKRMLETHYRASRFCRVLGNPTAYEILKTLIHRAATPTELAREIGLTTPTISDTLKNLRNIDVVRYETANKSKVYFLKDDSLIPIVNAIEKYVKRMRIKKW